MSEEVITNRVPEPEFLNRSARRELDKANPACKKCGIHWLERFKLWSNCTVGAWPTSPAEGHKFL